MLAGRNAGDVNATPFSCVKRRGSSPGTLSGCTTWKSIDCPGFANVRVPLIWWPRSTPPFGSDQPRLRSLGGAPSTGIVAKNAGPSVMDVCCMGATLPPKAAGALDLRTMSPPSSHGRLMTFFLGWAVVLYLVAVTVTVARRLGFLAWP